MENFAPGLRESVLALTDTLRVIVYFVCVAGLMLQVQQARADVEGMTRPLLRAIVIVGLVATLPHWFGFAERVFLTVADTVHEGYTEHPMRTSARLRETVSGGSSEFSLRRIGETLYQAFLHGSVKLVVLIGSLLQLPFLVLQYILKLLCYLFLPIALALFMIPSLTQLALRYVQQTLAVLAWPVGFAITELVAYHLLTAYADNLAVAYDLAPGQIDAASFASLLGGLLAALWLIIGTIATPFLMQGLICSGSPISGGGGTALQQLFALHQITALMRVMKAAGAAPPATLTQVKPGSGGGQPGAGGPGLSPPRPPAPPPPTPPAAPGASAPGPADPSGDARAAAALGLAQLPAPQTSI